MEKNSKANLRFNHEHCVVQEMGNSEQGIVRWEGKSQVETRDKSPANIIQSLRMLNQRGC
jgi:hypothetical protein